MARLIRSLVVIGTIAAFSPVHHSGELRADVAAHGRTLLTSILPQTADRAAKMAIDAGGLSQSFGSVDAATHNLMLQLAAAQLGKLAGAGRDVPTDGPKGAGRLR